MRRIHQTRVVTAERYQWLRELGYRHRRSALGLSALAVLAALLSAAWVVFGWVRRPENAAVLQAVGSILTLAATLVLLGLNWKQTNDARSAAARNEAFLREQLDQARDATDRNEAILRHQLDNALREQHRARQEDERRTVNAVMPMVTISHPAIDPPEAHAIARFTLIVSNAGVGVATMVRLVVGNAIAHDNHEAGFLTLRPNEATTVSFAAPNQGRRERRDVRPRLEPERPYGFDGILLAQVFAVYHDVFGNRYGSRMELYWNQSLRDFEVGPTIFLRDMDKVDDPIFKLRAAHIPPRVDL